MDVTPPPPPLTQRTTKVTDGSGLAVWNFPQEFPDLPVVFAVPEPTGDTTNAYVAQVVAKSTNSVTVKVTKMAPQAVALISLTVGLPSPAVGITVNLFAGIRSS